MECKPIRAAIVLFVLTALSLNIICGSFAKYTTSETSFDSARVAKWGVVLFAEGSLFGTGYNTVIDNDDSVTVKSFHTYELGNGTTTDNVVAPGTQNLTGLSLGLSGMPETAVQVDITIRNQNISLRPNVYYIIHKVIETVSETNFDSITARYGKLYKMSDQIFERVPEFDLTVDSYYYIDNETDLTDSGEWPYCPVVFELNPISGSGMTVNSTFNSSSSMSRYFSSFRDKSLDIISACSVWCGFNGGYSWPVKDNNDVFTRTISTVIPANMELATALSLNKDTKYNMANENLTWEWEFERAENTLLYNMADNILGRLAAEKTAGGLADNYVVIHDRTHGVDKNGHLTFSQNDNEILIRPVEYIDYCLETMFDIEMTVTQVD